MKILTLKNKEIREKISNGISSRLMKDGFVFKKALNQFESRLGESILIFNILLTRWSNSVSIQVRIYITRIDVETIYESILGKSHRLTMGNTIQRIYLSPDGKKIVNGNMDILLIYNEDLDSAIETLIKYYEDVAIPYFDKYRNLKEIDFLFNNAPFEYCPAHLGLNFDDRCMKGLIIANLVQNSGLEELIKIYDEKIIETMDTNSIDNYYKVKDYLIYNRLK